MSTYRDRTVLVLLLVACLLLVAGSASAQYPGGIIGLYSDEEGTCCFLYETLNTPYNVYVVHKDAPGAIASTFRVENNLSAMFVGVTYNGAKIGDIFTEVSVLYNNYACQALPYLIATMTFLPFEATPPIEGGLRVLPADGDNYFDVEMVDCNSVIQSAYGSLLMVNVDPNDIDYVPFGCSSSCLPVSNEESTWGKVKALYR